MTVRVRLALTGELEVLARFGAISGESKPKLHLFFFDLAVSFSRFSSVLAFSLPWTRLLTTACDRRMDANGFDAATQKELATFLEQEQAKAKLNAESSAREPRLRTNPLPPTPFSPANLLHFMIERFHSQCRAQS